MRRQWQYFFFCSGLMIAVGWAVRQCAPLLTNSHFYILNFGFYIICFFMIAEWAVRQCAPFLTNSLGFIFHPAPARIILLNWWHAAKPEIFSKKNSLNIANRFSVSIAWRQWIINQVPYKGTVRHSVALLWGVIVWFSPNYSNIDDCHMNDGGKMLFGILSKDILSFMHQSDIFLYPPLP